MSSREEVVYRISVMNSFQEFKSSKKFWKSKCVSTRNVWPANIVQNHNGPQLKLPGTQAKCTKGPFWTQLEHTEGPFLLSKAVWAEGPFWVWTISVGQTLRTANCLVIPPWHWNIRICCSSIFFIGFSFNIFNKDIRCKNKATIPIVAVNTNKVLDRLFY